MQACIDSEQQGYEARLRPRNGKYHRQRHHHHSRSAIHKGSTFILTLALHLLIPMSYNRNKPVVVVVVVIVLVVVIVVAVVVVVSSSSGSSDSKRGKLNNVLLIRAVLSVLQFELEACNVVAVVQYLVLLELGECDIVSPHVVVGSLVHEVLLDQI